MAEAKKPVLSYSIYLLVIFTLLVIIVLGAKGTNLDNYCPNKPVDCQIFLNQGEKSPYRQAVTATYTGWHFAGYADTKGCWVGLPKMCDYCDSSYSNRVNLCAKKYPEYRTKPGVGIFAEQPPKN